MLHFTGAITLNNSLYAEGNLPTHINTVSCRGAETLLLNCPFNNVAVGSCGRFEDAGIICQGIVPRIIYWYNFSVLHLHYSSS